VLHARYAVNNDFSRAEAAFKRILAKKSDYQPALVNLGNVAFLKNDFKNARILYEKAFAKNPNDPAVLLNLAKLSYEEGKYDKTESYYAMLRKRDQTLADRYQYLAMKGEGKDTRAAQADALKTAVEWGSRRGNVTPSLSRGEPRMPRMIRIYTHQSRTRQRRRAIRMPD